MNPLVPLGFFVFGYVGWLTLFSGRFRRRPRIALLDSMSSVRAWLILGMVYILLGLSMLWITLGFTDTERLSLPQPAPLLLPVADAEKLASVSDALRNFLQLIFVEEIPRVGLLILGIYLLGRLLPFRAVLWLALGVSSGWFALMHPQFPLQFLVMAGLIGAVLSLVALRNGLIISGLLHLLINHFKIGFFAPGLPQEIYAVAGYALLIAVLLIIWVLFERETLEKWA
jgi:hypothetical protein